MADGTRREATFEPTVAAVRAARGFVAAVAPVDDGSDDAERVALVTSELATNAVLHTGLPFTVRVDASIGSVRIAVRDRSTAPPVVGAPDLSAPSGRGLAIVGAVARHWGVEIEPAAGGKWVWAEVELHRPDR